MAGKYAPLSTHLALTPTGENAVSMTFDAVGRLVGGLPPSAYEYREWWANNGHSHASAWTVAGWLVAEVDLRGQRVIFRRVGQPRASTSVNMRPSDVPVASLPQLDAVAVTVRLIWRDAGEIALDDAGKIRSPLLPARPGLYRMTMVPSGARRPRVYVGETDQLRRRLQGYRGPGPTQYTNQRLNGILIPHLKEGHKAVLAIATEAAASQSTADATSPLDLTRKSNRLLAENAALFTLYAADAFDVENLD